MKNSIKLLLIMTCFVHQTFATKPSYEKEIQIPSKIKITDKTVLAASQSIWGAFLAKEALSQFNNSKFYNLINSRTAAKFANLNGTICLAVALSKFLSAYKLYTNDKAGSSKTDKAVAATEVAGATAVGSIALHTILFDSSAYITNPLALMAYLTSSTLAAYKLVK